MSLNGRKTLAAMAACCIAGPTLAGDWVLTTPFEKYFEESTYISVAYTSDKQVPGEVAMVGSDAVAFASGDTGRQYLMLFLIHADAGISGLQGIAIGRTNGAKIWLCKASGDGQSCEDIGDGTASSYLDSTCFDDAETAGAFLEGQIDRGFDCDEEPHNWMAVRTTFARSGAFPVELTGEDADERLFVYADYNQDGNAYSRLDYSVDRNLARAMKFKQVE